MQRLIVLAAALLLMGKSFSDGAEIPEIDAVGGNITLKVTTRPNSFQ
jgi:hypothetical protein